MKRFFPVTFLLVVLGSFPARTQHIPFDNYSVQEELDSKKLPQNFIYDIEQDHEGYIWLATQIGAIKYDGYNFVSFSEKNGLPENNVVDIFVDTRNRIWFSTASKGLAIMRENTLEMLNTENGLVSDYSIRVLENKQGDIFFFSYEGISIIREDTILNFNAENSHVTGEIFATKVLSDGSVWFSTLNNLFCYDSILHRMDNPVFRENPILSIAEDKPGSVWFASQERGIIHKEDHTISQFNTENGINSNIGYAVEAIGPDTVVFTTLLPEGIYRFVDGKPDKKWTLGVDDLYLIDLLVDKRGRIWISTFQNGIILIENDKLTQLTEKNNLINNRINKTIEDQNGNIWIATAGGISKYGKVVFEVFQDGFIENEREVLSIAAINNSIFLGTFNGLNILQEDQKIKWILPEQTGWMDIYSIIAENKKVQWLGTVHGIIRLENFKPTFISYLDQLEYEETTLLTYDLLFRREKLYCATDMGLVIYNRQHFSVLNTEDGLRDNQIWSIASDKNENIWCATVDGLSIYDGHSFHNYTTKEGLANNLCNDIAFDKDDNGWIATDGGVSRVTLHADWSISCRNYTTNNGLVSDATFLVLIDKPGHVWIGTTKGLDRLDPESGEIVNYGKLEGFSPVETSLGAATTTEGNDIWFGTVTGAVKYIPENDIKNTDPPRIYIQSVDLWNDSTDILKYAEGTQGSQQLPVNLSLPYFKKDLEFHYVGLHYTITEKNSYQYILEGFDTEWSEITHDIKTPPYRKIPPGKYTFKVKAANCDGIWTPEPAEFSFEIRPPFWQTWWFYALEIITGIFLLVVIIRLRERKLRQDKIILTQKVKERTLEIEKQRDQIAEQKKEITDSIEYAEKIQTAVLPKKEFLDNQLDDYFILFKPRDIVSGDFYWVQGKDGNIIVVAADCTGHGVPGAFMSMLGVSILNELASEPKPMRSNEILDTLREHLTITLRQTGREEDAKDGMDLALCIIDKKKMRVQFSGAYNPLVLVRDGECEVFKGDKMPVGFHLGEMNPFTAHDIQVQKGDCLYMFSDGYADQFGGPDSKKFKTAKLRELLISISNFPMDEQKSRLNETIEDWMGINEQVDDILVMGIRI